MTLETDLLALLAPAPPAPARILDGLLLPVPPKPVPRYRVRIDFSRPQYGWAEVEVEEDGDAADAYDIQKPIIHWNDEIDSEESMDDYPEWEECVNEDVLGQWDVLYEGAYNNDGYPECASCGDAGDGHTDVPIYAATNLCESCTPADDEDPDA